MIARFRRLAAPALAAAVLLLAASCASVRSAAPPPSGVAKSAPGEWRGGAAVATAYGALEGKPDRGGTIAWLGVPYAEPPVGPLRWKAPREPLPWAGVRQARRFGPRAAQISPYSGKISGAEDCLYLNVWRPASAETGLPVYVWIHGGGNTSGASDAAREYYGDGLAAKGDLVFVSVNYRLGVFGWFDHPALKCGEPETDSGNFGTLDLIAALSWVRGNISAFGGNPGNVTIAGESAGALNVLTLLIAPAASGLFQRAVAESGYTRMTDARPREFALDTARALAIRKGAAAGDAEADAFFASRGDAETAAWLRKASAADLLQASKSRGKKALSLPCPIFDGAVLPAEGFAALAEPSRAADVPLVIGTNKEETKLFFTLWGLNYRDPAYPKLVELSSAIWKAEGADGVADAIRSAGRSSPVFLYRFDWGAPDARGNGVMGKSAGERIGASHGIEISFFLQNDSVYGGALPFRIFTNANARGRLDLRARIGGYLANFVRSGDPNSGGPMDSGSPRWEPWDSASDSPAFLVLDADRRSAVIRMERGRTTRESALRKVAAEPSVSFREKWDEISPMFP